MTTLYQARIIDYCQRHGIVVPEGFITPKSPERFVIVDESSSPPSLMFQTTEHEKELLGWATEIRNTGRAIRLLDFKRCCELAISGSGTFKRFRNIDAYSNEERKQQDKLNQSDA
jgi:hypothetical protein